MEEVFICWRRFMLDCLLFYIEVMDFFYLHWFTTQNCHKFLFLKKQILSKFAYFSSICDNFWWNQCLLVFIKFNELLSLRLQFKRRSSVGLFYKALEGLVHTSWKQTISSCLKIQFSALTWSTRAFAIGGPRLTKHCRLHARPAGGAVILAFINFQGKKTR